jgi:hypothetical protein
MQWDGGGAPLTRAELEELVQQLREYWLVTAPQLAILLPRFEAICGQFRPLAKQETLSQEQLFGMLSFNPAAIAKTAVGSSGAVGKTGLYFLAKAILNDYINSLIELSETGSLRYMHEIMQVFIQNLQSHYDFNTETQSQAWFKNGLLITLGQIRRNN